MRVLALVALALLSPPLAAEVPAGHAALEAGLRDTEIAFAATMARRDLAAFANFLAEEAIFIGREPLRGKAAVVAGWSRLFEGPTAPFSWQPDLAVVLPSGDLGLTSGPVVAPDGKRVGTFTSTWRRQADGSWRIVLDKGCPPCDCGAKAP